MKIRYAHTNIIAKDWKKLSAFYRQVFGCVPVPPGRDMGGEWLDKLTGIGQVHVVGEHLALPGYGENPPTLEIFSYNREGAESVRDINMFGLAHLAFEVDDVAAVLQKVMEAGGGRVGALVKTEIPGKGLLTIVYARDIEGNIIELQSWS
jgi:catechol 2,3-dioxygenase-like lactoylglutathione lyase family enzyme